MAQGLARFSTPEFGLVQATEIRDMIAAGRRAEADELLRQYVHRGVAPTELFTVAMALALEGGG